MLTQQDVAAPVKRLTLLALLLGALSGCGFQLRGQVDLPPSMATTYVVASDDLSRELRLLLRANEVAIVADRRSAGAVLQVSSESLQREVQSIGERARVREYALRYSLRVSVIDAEGAVIVPAQTIELVRDYTLDETQILGVASEEEIIRQELRREMAREIVRRLEYAQT